MAGPVFDTGMPLAQRTLLRRAIAAKLAPLLFANGGYLRAIRALPRPLKGHYEDEVGWIGLIGQGQAPVVFVAIGGATFANNGMDIPPTHARGRIEVAIYVASSSARNYIDGRLETDVVAAADVTQDPGVDAILENVQELLLGQSYELDNELAQVTTAMTAESEDEVFTNGDITIWEQRYSVKVTREINPNRLIKQLVTTVEVQNNLDQADPVNPIVDTIATLEAPP